VPILVHVDVMDAAGMSPEQDMPAQANPSPTPRKEAPAPLSDEANDRLSIFKDFIDKLDIDSPDKDKPDLP